MYMKYANMWIYYVYSVYTMYAYLPSWNTFIISAFEFVDPVAQWSNSKLYRDSSRMNHGWKKGVTKIGCSSQLAACWQVGLWAICKWNIETLL